MQQTTQIQASSLEITAVGNEKKPNSLVGFFKGVRDKFSKKAEQDTTNATQPKILPKILQSGNIKKERVAYASERNRPDINDKDILMDKTLFAFFIEMLEHLINKKKFVVDDIVEKLRKNETLTRAKCDYDTKCFGKECKFIKRTHRSQARTSHK